MTAEIDNYRIALCLERDSAMPVVVFGCRLYRLTTLEEMGIVKLSAMDRMILGDLGRKLKAIAVELENAG